MSKIVNQKSYTEVQIRLSLHTFMQILSPSAIKLWPGHRYGERIIKIIKIIKAVRSVLGHYTIV